MVNYLKELVHEKNHHQLALAIIFLVYIFLNKIKMPKAVAECISNIGGSIIVSLIALGLLFTANPIVGILGIVVAYLLIERSNQQMKNNSSIGTVIKNEMEKMDKFFNVENQFPKTLEEEIVEKRTMHKSEPDLISPSYKPLLCELPGSTLL